MPSLQLLFEKYKQNIPLADDELDFVISELKKCILLMEQLGPDHRLSVKQLRQDFTTLEGFQRARKEK